MRIDSKRLYRRLEELGQVGAYTDEASGLRGVRRLALSPEDEAGRELVTGWMQELGLTVGLDAVGNLYARREGTEPELAPVMIGSHLDTGVTSGRFDGALGVLGALEVIAALNDSGTQTRRPVVVASFTDSEGGRFESDQLGSAVAAGRITLEQAYAVTDHEGVTVLDALEAAECVGPLPSPLPAPHAFIELHIEQGPLLRAHDADVGVVTGVQACTWHSLTITGRSAPAGTTPLGLRRDAGVAAAKINLELRRMVASGEYGQLRATMGALRLEPNVVNVIPGRCVASVDLRNPSDDEMGEALADVREAYQRIAGEEGVELSWNVTGSWPCMAFDANLRATIGEAADELGLRYAAIRSGAGHDAQEMASLCPSAMIFVPGEHEGISHHPSELSTPEQCASGAELLLQVVLDLAG